MAAILDEFSSRCFAPDCDLLPLSVHDWKKELDAFDAELLLVESAWWGHRRQWHRHVSGAAPVLRELLAWCRKRGIASVFWNKEDPVHFDRFLAAASLFDAVFTTDVDCVARYKQALGHERVHVLPFACQPAEHNPIDLAGRSAGACYAGSYYVRYPERARDLRMLVDTLCGMMPIDIFDRYLDSGDSNYVFPPEYAPFIKGTLSAENVAQAYKGYRYGINLNTVKRSGSMFARRVFELMASGTTVVSNDSLGMRQLFGELVICSDRAGEIRDRLVALVEDDALRARRNVAAVRKVMQEHTYAHRLATVAAHALQRTVAVPLPAVLVLAHVASPAQRDAIVQAVLRQHHAHWRLVMVLAHPGLECGTWGGDRRIGTLAQADFHGRLVAGLAPADFAHDWVCPMVPQDYYGAHYLTDMVMATRYSEAAAICKGAHFAVSSCAIMQHSAESAYRPCRQVPLRSAMVARQCLAGQPALPWLSRLGEEVLEIDGLAIDPFNYCRDALLLDGIAGRDEVSRHVDDLVVDTGMPIDVLYRHAATLSAPMAPASRIPWLTAGSLAALFDAWHGSLTQAELDEHGWHIVSELLDGQEEEVFSATVTDPGTLRAAGVWRFVVETGPGLALQLLVECLDFEGARLARRAFACNSNQELVLPFGTRALRLGWRIASSGSTRVHRLWLGWRPA